MKNVYMIGIGMGNSGGLSVECRKIIETADFVAGASRVVESVKNLLNKKCEVLCSYDPSEIASKMETLSFKTAKLPFHFCVVFSGDVGFYSGAKKLSALLHKSGWNVIFKSGESSFQYLSSKLCEPWQDWSLVSAHGTECDIACEIALNDATFFLTGGKITAKTIVDFVLENQISSRLVVADRLGYDDEIIIDLCLDFCDEKKHSAFAMKNSDYEKLSEMKLACVLVDRRGFKSEEEKNRPPFMDSAFSRNFPKKTDSENAAESEKLVPMTKRMVRSAVLSLLSVRDGETVWDVGAGTGAVSIDIAKSAKCHVFSVDANESAVNLEKKNRKKFGAWNVDLHLGRAKDVLPDFPPPSAVFVGGSEGELSEIISIAFEKNPSARVLVSSVTAETFADCVVICEKMNLSMEITEIAVSASQKIGKIHMRKSENAVSLILLNKNAE